MAMSGAAPAEGHVRDYGVWGDPDTESTTLQQRARAMALQIEHRSR